MKVLIVRLSSLGDVIQGIPCLVALKESFPSWQISWLTEELSAPVLEGHPHLDRLFVLNRRWRKAGRALHPSNLASGAANFWQIHRALRAEHFDVAVDLQGLFKSGLWSRLSGAPRRIGHDRTRELAHWFLNEYVSDRPTFDPHYPLIQRYLDPARYLGADVRRARYVLPPATVESAAAADRLLAQGATATPLVAFCPWSAWPSKNWSLECWTKLARALDGEARLLLIGSEGDAPAAAALVRETPALLNLTGKTPLPVLAEIFRRCRLVIGPDSGPIHFANATGVPRLLMLFGSTSRPRSGPFGEGHEALALDLECQPCFERLCPLGHQDCLGKIDVPRVLERARELLRRAG